MELAYVVRNDLKLGEFNLDGCSRVVKEKSQQLREKVVNWFISGLDEPVEGMGTCLDLHNKEVSVTRKRIILMDLEERRTSRSPSTSEEENAQVSLYLKRMAQPGKWGGTPELVAFAHMSKRPIRIFKKNRTGLHLCQEFVCPDTDPSVVVNLLHESTTGLSDNHYSTLVTVEEEQVIKKYELDFITLV